MVCAVFKFLHYIYGWNLRIEAYHHVLCCLSRLKHPSERLTRLSLIMQNHHFTLALDEPPLRGQPVSLFTAEMRPTRKVEARGWLAGRSWHWQYKLYVLDSSLAAAYTTLLVCGDLANAVARTGHQINYFITSFDDAPMHDMDGPRCWLFVKRSSRKLFIYITNNPKDDNVFLEKTLFQSTCELISNEKVAHDQQIPAILAPMRNQEGLQYEELC